MLNDILSFFVEHWLGSIAGLILTGAGLWLKRYWTLDRKDRQSKQDEHFKDLVKNIVEDNKKLVEACNEEHANMNERYIKMYDDISTKMAQTLQQVREDSERNDSILQQQITQIESAILSNQRKIIISECEKLLDPDHEIEAEEWIDLQEDYKVYHNLGGNSRGEMIFNLVKDKVNKTLFTEHE